MACPRNKSPADKKSPLYVNFMSIPACALGVCCRYGSGTMCANVSKMVPWSNDQSDQCAEQTPGVLSRWRVKVGNLVLEDPRCPKAWAPNGSLRHWPSSKQEGGEPTTTSRTASATS